MNYAVNAKIRAMRATALENIFPQHEQSYDDFIQRETKRILPYLKKNSRDFVSAWTKNFDAYKALQNLRALDKPDRDSLRRVFGTEIDLRNILIIFRLKKFYGLDGDLIFSFLIPAKYKLNSDDLKNLAHTKNFSQEVANGKYGAVFENNFEHGEQILSRFVYSQFKKERRRENLAVVCEYLFARRIEIKNLRAKNEGTRLGLSHEEIFSLLH
ncbi:MAG: V-type ATPase subunit [Defluviitaleaceae bacterium]|nr:V-type ATPase subunit [Defluviitaleaceae bacterium]